jgi:hypothetical protein
MDAGSGAKKAITEEMIGIVAKHIDAPLIVGGGIRDAEKAYPELQGRRRCDRDRKRYRKRRFTNHRNSSRHSPGSFGFLRLTSGFLLSLSTVCLFH